MVPPAPHVLRLPQAWLLAPRPVPWPLLVRGEGRRRAGPRLTAAFAFRNDERAFARALARRKPNLWVFRSNQQRFCGDFVVVDMSSPRPGRRPVWVVDLKRGLALRTGGGGAGVQFRNADRAVREVAERTGVVPPEAGFELVAGDKAAVLDYLCAETI